jgi:SAM-dependent methyltransferase
VRRYYDANTGIFRLFEPKGDTIHRAVWAPGVRSRRAAVAYTNELVCAAVASLARATHTGDANANANADANAPALRLIDLGCGTGGTFLHLADHLRHPWSGVAVTLSPVQVARAQRSFARAGIADGCAVVLADYVDVPESGPFDVAIAIESLVHCPQPAAFFREAARLLRPGGRLLLCDDLLSSRAVTVALLPAEALCLREFARGWLAPAQQSVASLDSLASAAGFRVVANDDLTPLLRLMPGAGRRVVRAALGELLRMSGLDLPIVSGLGGGLALQLALARGLIEYRWICLERV